MRIPSAAQPALPPHPPGSRLIVPPARRSGAFTLVELLVAMTVSLLLVFVLLRVFTTATTSWQKGEAQADAYREARGALQLMARDLSTIITPVTLNLDGTTTAALPLLPTLVLNRHTAPEPAPPGGTEGLNEEIYCLTNIVNSSTPAAAASPSATPGVQTMPSETCAVGYFCQWLPDIAAPGAAASRAPHAFALMRQFLNSDGVAARLQLANGAKLPVPFLNLYARNSLLPGAATTTTPPAATSTQLAAYIWDVKFRIPTTLAATDGESGATPPYDRPPSSGGGSSTGPPRVYNGTSTPALPYPSVLPPYVEIRFKALSTGAGRRLEGNNQVTAQDWQTPAADTTPSPVYRQLILPNARQFVLRVPLINSNPLPQL